MNYKATFNLKNGIKGEITLTAESDGDAFIAACKMFAFADTIEWKVEKAETRMSTAEKINKACEKIDEISNFVEAEYEQQNRELEALKDSGRDDDVRLEELVTRLDYALDGLANAKDDLIKALKAVQK